MLQRLGFPAIGPHRRFVTATAIDAIGSGVFMPVSMLYFLATTELSLVQVGAALSLASLIALPSGPLVGGLVDRYGAKPVLLASNGVQGLGFAAYLVSDSFWVVTLWTLVVTVGRTAFWGAFAPIVTAISAPGERERWFGFLGAMRNVGFAVGGLAAGVVVSLDTEAAYAAVVVLNAVSYGVALVLLLAVPDAARPAPADRARPGSWGDVLRDRPYRTLLTVQLAYSVAMMVLNVAIPVYATTVLGLPGWVTGAVFTVNTLMIGLGQGLVVTAATGRRRWRVLVVANLAFAASFLVLLGASALGVAVATAVVLIGAIVYTVGELLGGPVLSALTAEAAPAHLRGRYLSLVQLTWNVASTVAPVGFAWLLDRGPAPIWAVLAVVSVLAALVSLRLPTALPLARLGVGQDPAVLEQRDSGADAKLG
ncbi:MFS transporter [Nocardioides pantholopis]|uniref:MFS transporter n=1 Tax=Nocardioides pantholopis TaxID=2483798 RepID=UPI001F4959C5|nr:MFS transporter [Nocardioides pantholopis]